MQKSLTRLVQLGLASRRASQRRVATPSSVLGLSQFTRSQFGSRGFSWNTSKQYSTSKDDAEKKPEEKSQEKGRQEPKKNAEKDSEKGLNPDVAALLEKTKADLDSIQKQNSQLKDRYMRAIADFRNLQGTTQREMQKAKDFALQKFSKDLIETLDNFDHAIDAVKTEDLGSNAGLSTFYDGVKMTKNVFEKTLQKHGIKKIDPLDKEFDPNLHEAVFQLEMPNKEPGTVFSVQQPGYELNGRVLRAAKVGVAKAPEGKEEKK